MRPILRLAAILAAAVSFLMPASAFDVQVIKSSGGIEAWLVEQRGLPIISVQAGFDGGGRLDPEGKEGLAYLASTLMNEGAGDMDSTTFMQRLQDKAINFGGSADNDAFYIGLTTLTANKAEAFEMARTGITSPRFDQEAIDRMKAQIFAYQKQLDEDPSAIASMTFSQRAFAGHPYGRRLVGTGESVAAITRDDIVDFMQTRLGRDKLKVVIVGDIDAAEAGPLLDTLFGAIPATRQATDPGRITMQGAGKTDLVERDIPQSIVVFGAPGLPISDPQFRAAQVMNYTLGGGGFMSRLMTELREKRGLTYGVSTGIAGNRFSDTLMGSFATDNARVKEAMDLAKAEIAKMRDTGITEQEMQDAKAYLTGAYALNFDSNSKIASGLLGLYLQGFDKDYINRRNAEIEAVTMDEVKAIAQKLLDPAAFYFIVVGKPQGL